MIESIEKVNNIKQLIEFVDNNNCYHNFHHNELDWIKSDNLRNDFFDRLFELINEGKNYILVADLASNNEESETFIGTKEQVLQHLQELEGNFEYYNREFSEENFVVYNAIENKHVIISIAKIWNWNETY